MTKIITDALDINRLIAKLPRNAELFASSFNISTWLSYGPARLLLHELNIRNSHALIGVPEFKSCTGEMGMGQCKDCYSFHKKKISKLASLRNEYSNIDWRFVKNIHAKFLVAKPLVLTGGRNISDSKGNDLTFAVNDTALADELIKLWHGFTTKEYDIGTSGPLVFTMPYRGELMADSTSIPDDYKKEVATTQNNLVAGYWKKQFPQD